jgi:hypothetical protein
MVSVTYYSDIRSMPYQVTRGIQPRRGLRHPQLRTQASKPFEPLVDLGSATEFIRGLQAQTVESWRSAARVAETAVATGLVYSAYRKFVRP